MSTGIAGELVIGPESIKGTLAGSPKRAFATVRVNDPDLVKELDERKSVIRDGMKIDF
jgi:cell division protease FtsH